MNLNRAFYIKNILCISSYVFKKALVNFISWAKFIVKRIKKIPRDFNSEIYLELNPDIECAGVDPELHYLTHGRFEGRDYKGPELTFLSTQDLETKERTILIVSHNASSEYSSVHSYNLVQELIKSYNVIVLLLGAGELLEAFIDLRVEIILEPTIASSSQLASRVIAQICRRHNFLFSIVSSVESCVVLSPLASRFIPTVMLFHEFASHTTTSVFRFREAFLWATQPIFSSILAQKEKLVKFADLCDCTTNVIPETGSMCISYIENIAFSASKRMKQEELDAQFILKMAVLQKEFTFPHYNDISLKSLIRLYVRGWASGVEQRKPYPGFHPGIYLEQHGLSIEVSDPLADYLRSGQPQGPWAYPVILEQSFQESSFLYNMRIALHLHVYYPELLDEIIKKLIHNTMRPDLFISVKDETSKQVILKTLMNYTGKVIDIQIVPNRGRNIGPLLTTFGRALIKNYDFIGHLHTKKSLDYTNLMIGEEWFSFLLDNLLGGVHAGKMADSILLAMINDPSIGIVFPEEPYNVGWSENRAIAESICVKLSISQPPHFFIFPVGTMFWARAATLQPFVNLDFSWEDYPEEPLPCDGTLLHAIERLLGVVHLPEKKSAVTYVPGMVRKIGYFG